MLEPKRKTAAKDVQTSTPAAESPPVRPADQRENLYQHDLGVVRPRRLHQAQAARRSSAQPASAS